MKNFIKKLYKNHDPLNGFMFSFIASIVVFLFMVEYPDDLYCIFYPIVIILVAIACVEFIALIVKTWEPGAWGLAMMTTGVIVFFIFLKFFPKIHFSFFLFPFLLVFVGWINVGINVMKRLEKWKNGNK